MSGGGVETLAVALGFTTLHWSEHVQSLDEVWTLAVALDFATNIYAF